MSRLDVVIFGATGFTGKYTAIEMVRLGKKHGLSWGVAGRSQQKLESLMAFVANKTGETLSQIRTIVADVKDERSLREMCQQAKVLVNCCGPYRLYGEPVVKAAIDCKTHHVDVSGEPLYMEAMQLYYDKAARDAGVYVISGCGFDSIPADMGVLFLQEHFGGTLNSVESYVSTSIAPEMRAEAKKYGTIHEGTWQSLIYSLQNSGQLKPQRQKLYPERLPVKFKLARRSAVHKHAGHWHVPFLGSDESVVYRSQRALAGGSPAGGSSAGGSPAGGSGAGGPPVQMRAYLRQESWGKAVAMFLGLGLLFLLSKMKFTRNLLVSYPKAFSMGLVNPAGPTEAVTKASSFQLELRGEGWPAGSDLSAPPTKKLVARVSGDNAGYGSTVRALLLAAITITREGDHMPANGGVLTTAVAFKNTNLIKSLMEEKIKFEIVANE